MPTLSGLIKMYYSRGKENRTRPFANRSTNPTSRKLKPSGMRISRISMPRLLVGSVLDVDWIVHFTLSTAPCRTIDRVSGFLNTCFIVPPGSIASTRKLSVVLADRQRNEEARVSILQNSE